MEHSHIFSVPFALQLLALKEINFQLSQLNSHWSRIPLNLQLVAPNLKEVMQYLQDLLHSYLFPCLKG
jgi:hypothetical protein